MTKTNVKATIRKDGTKVRAHDRRVKRGSRSGAADREVAAAAAVAAAVAASSREDDHWSDDVSHSLAGSLAKRGNPESDGERRLAAGLQKYFSSREAWKDTLRTHATLIERTSLKGWRNLQDAMLHMDYLWSRGEKPVGITMSRSNWEKQGRTVTGEGFEISVPVTKKEEKEEDPETGEMVTTKPARRYFLHGGAKRRHYDACETEGGERLHTSRTVRADLWEAAKTRTALSESEVQELFDGFAAKAADWGYEVEVVPAAELRRGSHGDANLDSKKIRVSEEQSLAERTGVLVHEMAHASDPALQHDNWAQRYQRDRAACEFVAESVAFAVLDRYGIDSSESSAMYLQGWKPDRVKQAGNVLKRSIKAMDAILERSESPSSTDNAATASS